MKFLLKNAYAVIAVLGIIISFYASFQGIKNQTDQNTKDINDLDSLSDHRYEKIIRNEEKIKNNEEKIDMLIKKLHENN